MLLRHASKRTRVVLFDFLAPTLVRSRNASAAGRPLAFTREEVVPPAPSSASRDPARLQQIRAQISNLGSPSASVPSDSDVEYFNKSTAYLQSALKEGNLDKAWQHWSGLEKRRLLQFLSPAQLDAYSRLTEVLLPSLETGKHNDAHLRAVETIALVTACGGATTALQACMDIHVKRQEPEAILNLWRRYAELWDGTHDLKGPQVDEDEEAEDFRELIEPATGGQSSYSPGRAQLLIYAITAHAMQDSFHDALHLSLQLGIRMKPLTVTLFMKRLSHDEALQRKVSQYIRVLDTARLVSLPATLSKQISNLMNDQATNSLERLYSSIHAGFSGPYPWLAATPESVSSERPVLMPTVGWTSFILAFLKCRKPELAEKLWNDMVELGIKPGVEMWTALLDGYGAIRALDETLVTWESMKAAKIKPDPMAYRAFISTLFHMRKPDQAMGRFREFEKSGQAKDAETSQILAVYNTALHGLLLNFKEEEARSLYERMKETGPTPDIVSYNTFLRFHARKGDMKSFADWLKALTDAGLVGDVFTWSTVLFALFKAGRKDGPQMVTNIMRVQNIEPNVATYTSIIDHAVRERDEATLKAAFDLLRWMEQQEPEVRPNQVTYTSILSGMYRDEWLDPAVREECRVYIMESMQRRKMQPNRVTYHILLKACLRNPGPEGLRQALSYYNEMGERKIHKDYDTWYIILQGLVRRGDWDVAQEMVNEIRRTGFTPSGGLLNLIHKVYARPTKVQKGGRRRPA